MKKTLAAIAVLGAFAGSALAADVTLYGRVDTGFQYNHTNPAKGHSTSKFSMEPGQSSGSRWGLKGVEDLGAFKVGFILEDGFTSDDGAEKGVMFDRESALFIEGGFGKLAVGRIGSINQGTSSWAQLAGVSSPFSTSYGNAAVSQVLVTDDVRNNMVSYQTPTVAGFTGFAQYGMGDTVAEDKTKTEKVYAQVENESSTDRYYAIGAKYANGPLTAYAAVDSINYKSYSALSGIENHNTLHNVDDSLTVTAAVNYDFDVAKVYVAAQYFDEVKGKFDQGKLEGYGLTASVAAPVAGGKLMAAIGYVDAEPAGSVTDGLKGAALKAKDFDFTRYQLAVGYNYSLSKRTSVYAAASLLKDKVDYAEAGKEDAKTTKGQAMFGLLHTF